MATETPSLAPSPPSNAYTIIEPPHRHTWTSGDLLGVSHDDRYQYELIRGELRRMSPASHRHGRLEVRLIVAIGKYLEAHPLGEVFSGDTGFVLEDAPLTIRAPDVAFVAAERIPADAPAFLPLAPDLVIEIISPSETARSIAEKVSDYLRTGTRLLWLVYPEQQEVQAYAPDQPFHIYRSTDALDGRGILPGFHYLLRDLFA
ncbi:Uma2 family endonuclease [Candidatus Chloroploca sp. M-50]|uniref:Uma2 family endonuclease n=1 Tax=Candidatus Chloroploca mongolica TaxID=2528176 RepID=A0ABS4DDG1_9CHLR|nr:Uma2 family endonuclease [Candidatus Chloroploca mongolica]MBP1467475.1 Uma2 family endonuclease [Candidatus Chloroploca mongolica]